MTKDNRITKALSKEVIKNQTEVAEISNESESKNKRRSRIEIVSDVPW